MLRKLYYFLPPSLRLTARKIFYFPLDLYENLSGERGKDIPKKGDIFTGGGDYVTQGKKQLRHLQDYLNLSANDQVLDIGCGIGRTAYPLQKFLNAEGSYDGFDAMEKGIKWCKKNIEPNHQNFNFKYTPLKNGLYNDSKGNAAEFIFPYEDNRFDKAFLYSVFTHMKIAEIQNYLNEIYRVLKPGGTCLATFFLYKKGDDLHLNDGFKFLVQKDGYRLLDKNVEEANIALEYETLQKMVADSGLKITNKIDGFWRDKVQKSENINFQDIIILKK